MPDSGTPRDLVGNSSKRAAQLVTGNASHTRMEQIGQIRDLADDPAQPRRIRQVAAAALERIRDGHPVNPAYLLVQAALGNKVAEPAKQRPTDAELAAIDRGSAGSTRTKSSTVTTNLATAKFAATPRMWVLTFHDLDGWLGKYDPADLATSVTATEWAAFKRVAVQIRAFELEHPRRPPGAVRPAVRADRRNEPPDLTRGVLNSDPV